MILSTNEAQLTLEALDKLIIATEWRGLRTRAQRDALDKLRQRRTALTALLEARREQAPNKIIDLTIWRDGKPRGKHSDPAGSAASLAPPAEPARSAAP